MRLSEKLKQVSHTGTALLATNFYNFETLSGVLQAAKNKRAAIILQLSEGSLQYLGISLAASMAREGLKEFSVEGWLHLDHGNSVDVVRRCLDAGFDSVMIDASEKSFEENVKVTREVVELASQYGANVEAELGYVAKLGQVQSDVFTRPDEARQFVQETGVDALAIAIGSAHGFYRAPPKLQLDLIAQIHQVTPAALVLHGSSGIPDEQIVQAIKKGIAKVNLATETKNIFMKRLQEKLTHNDEIDLRKVFPTATASVVQLIEQKLDVISKV